MDKKQRFARFISKSEPGPGDGGRTGSWRVARPVIDHAKCIPAKKGRPAWFKLWIFCPDGVVSKTVPPKIDYEYCKGCGICAAECPACAITMVAETEIEKERAGQRRKES